MALVKAAGRKAYEIRLRVDGKDQRFPGVPDEGVSAVMQADQLQKFARHAKIETTMRYVHTDKDAMRRRADQLALPAPAFPVEQAPTYPRPKRGRKPANLANVAVSP